MTTQHHQVELGMRVGLPAGVTSKPLLANVGRRRLVLTSADSTNVATLLKWTRAGYETAMRSSARLGDYLQVFADGFNLGTVLAEALMRGDIPVEIVDDSTLHVMLSAEQASLYMSRARGISPLGEATLLASA